MGLTVTEDTPADMLTGSMELLVQLPRDHHTHTQRVTVPRSTPMMDLLVQVATAHKLAPSNYTLQAIGERGLVLSHHPNTPIGALDALQVKLLPKQGTFMPRKVKQANQPFETTFRLQVHLPRNQLYVSRVSPKMNLGEILDEVCREKGLDRSKYELRHPANVEEILDPTLSLVDYHLQEVTLCPKLRSLGSALSSQDIMALQRQEERRRQQAKQGVFGFMMKKSKESSLSTDSLGGRSVSPARSDETGRSASPQQPPPARPQRKRRPAPKPPVMQKEVITENAKEKIVISHSRNSSDSSGYHEASVLSDNPDSNSRFPETLPRRSKLPTTMESPRKLVQTSHASKSLGNLAATSSGMSHGVSNTSLSSAGLRKKKAAPPPPKARPLSSAISTQALERIVDSEESLTSDMELSKPSSDIGASSKADSDIGVTFNASSDVVVNSIDSIINSGVNSKTNSEIGVATKIISDIGKDSKVNFGIGSRADFEIESTDIGILQEKSEIEPPQQDASKVEPARVETRVGVPASNPKLRIDCSSDSIASSSPKAPKRRAPLPSSKPRTLSKSTDSLNSLGSTPDIVKIVRPTSNDFTFDDYKNVFNIEHDERRSESSEKNHWSNSEDSTSFSSMETLIENGPTIKKRDILNLNLNNKQQYPVENPTLNPKKAAAPAPAQERTEPIAMPRHKEQILVRGTDLKSANTKFFEANSTNDSEPKNVESRIRDSKSIDTNEATQFEAKNIIHTETVKETDLNTGVNDTRSITGKRDVKKVPDKPRRKTSEDAEIANGIHSEQKLKKSKSQGHVSENRIENSVRKVISPEQPKPTDKTKNVHNVKSERLLNGMSTQDESTRIKAPLRAEKNVGIRNYSEDNNIVLSVDNSKQFQKSPNSGKRSLSKTSLKTTRSMNDIYTTQRREKESNILNINDSTEKRRSCAVISTIPKCDIFKPKEDEIDIDKIIQQIVETVDKEKQKSNRVKQKYDTIRSKGSLGFSFGAGKSIIDYDQDTEKLDKSETRNEDELEELENLEMFERIRKRSNRPQILRSHSELNNFEINAFQKPNRHSTCQSEDFPFAMNPKFSSILSPDTFGENPLEKQTDWNSELIEALPKGASDLSLKILQSTTELPAFLRTGANLPHRTNLESLEDDAMPANWIVGESDSDGGLSETDILLRKVSDTLSGSLPPPSLPPPSPPASQRSSVDSQQKPPSNVEVLNPVDSLLSKATEALSQTLESTKKVEINVKNDQVRNKNLNISPEETFLRTSTPNLTISTGQDTSDYVSGTGEDLSISSWQYQLPAPPSAFRDADSPASEGYETITLGSVEAFKEPSIARIVNQQVAKETIEAYDDPLVKELLKKPISTDGKSNLEEKLKLEPQIEVTPPTPMEERSFDRQTSSDSHRSDSLELKREMISELENRIENGRLSRSSSKAGDPDSRRASDMSSTPSIAPVDNTLSNFTITTYSRQKSLDIFDEVEDQSGTPSRKNLEVGPGRTIVNQDDYNSRKSSETMRITATMNRNRTNSETSNGSVASRKSSATLDRDFLFRKNSNSSVQSVERNLTDDAEFKKPAPKIFKQHESLTRRQSFNNDNEKSTNVYRSKSHISLGNNSRYRNDSIGENERTKSITSLNSEDDEGDMKKSVSVSSLNQEMPRTNEKFSQWRDKFLKRQEEPTKEKQLQSLQVLKNILPQLKNTQHTEGNVFEQSRDKSTEEMRSQILPSESSPEAPIVSTTTEALSKTEPEVGPHKLQAEGPHVKRYAYAGPPAINLGSWSERPHVNVHIKNDMDYKFGKNSTSGAKTVVNLNGPTDGGNYAKTNGTAKSKLPAFEVKMNIIKNEVNPEVRQSERKEPDELTKKLITHTTAIGFKRPVLNKVGFPETKVQPKTEDKPVVTGVELKKTFAEKHEALKKQEIEIDDRPINFRELTKAFGQEVNLRAKPKYATQNRHSEYYSVKPEVPKNYTRIDGNQNGYVPSNNIVKQPEPVRNGHVLSNGILQNGTQNSPVKRYTSVVGINNSQNSNVATQNVNFTAKNTNLIKINGGPMPVVKGFKIQTTQVVTSQNIPNDNTAKQNGFDTKRNSGPPKAPTMPVITGVTLKSAKARPKSMPIQADPRDTLLESIRNFGGCKKLKSVGKRY